MNQFKEIAGIAAGILSIVSFIPYTRSILAGTTKPARSTWIIWSMIAAFFLVSYYQVGGGTAIWLSMGYFIAVSFTALLSLKYGVGGWNRVDKIAFAGCGVILALWLITGSALVGLLATIALDIFGALATVVKTWRFPEQEDSVMWRLDFVANVINLFAVPQWDLAHASYPVYMVIGVGGIMLLTLRKPSRQQAKTS